MKEIMVLEKNRNTSQNDWDYMKEILVLLSKKYNFKWYAKMVEDQSLNPQKLQ